MRAKKGKQKGFTLALVLILSTVIVLLSLGIAYISQTGFLSVAAENKYRIAENEADWGLNQVIEAVKSGTQNCTGTFTLTPPGGKGIVKIFTTSAGDTCFVWSKAEYGDAEVAKVAAISVGNSPSYGAVLIRDTTKLGFAPGATIESCDYTCVTPAMILGGNFSPTYYRTRPWWQQYYSLQVTNCSSLPALSWRGGKKNSTVYIASNAIPQVETGADFSKIYNTLFGYGVNDQKDLVSKLSKNYGVTFNGSVPVGITAQKVWVPPEGLSNISCTAQNSYIYCSATNGSSKTSFVIKVNPDGTFSYGSQTYDALNLKSGSLTVVDLPGGKVVAKEVDVKGSLKNALVVATEDLTIVKRATVSNSELFSSNFYLEKTRGGGPPVVNLYSTLIYAGGDEAKVNLFHGGPPIDLGTPEAPVSFIFNTKTVDFEAQGTHGAGKGGSTKELNGLLFVTERAQNATILMERPYTFNGAIVSNTPNTTFELRTTVAFNSTIIRNLASQFDFLKEPRCGVPQVKESVLFTKMQVY